jgi:hypothetical protein
MLLVSAALPAALWRILPAAVKGEGGKPRCSLVENRFNPPMKLTNPSTRFPRVLAIVLLAGVGGLFSANLHAAAQEQPQQKPAVAQRLFASPDEAEKALQTATAAKDKAALSEIFGPQVKDLLTGDAVQDADNAQAFATAMSEACHLVKEGEDKIVFEVGTNNWPMAIPLVSANGQWHFDTAAGKEEIISRHIGKDELCAIGVCRAYVAAQRQYVSANQGVGGTANYAQKFKSTAGKRDGLFWPTAANEPASPFGPLVAEAHAESYVNTTNSGPHPFHGYYFRILTRQGPAAPGGKKDYLSRGNLTGGFALVAYPEHWDQSGIMTFIIAQDGKVFQRNLGEKTSRIAGAIKVYNPDRDWTPVQDEGVLSAVSEK